MIKIRKTTKATALVTTAALLAFLAGCNSTSTEESTSSTNQTVVATDSVYPLGSLDDVVTYATQYSVFTISDDREGAPEGEGPEPYIPRFVTVEILETLWSDPENLGVVEPGTSFEMLAWGSIGGADRSELVPDGRTRLEVGETYVGGLVFDRNEWGTYPGTIAASDLAGLITQLPNEESILGELAPATTVELAALLAAATPDPRASQFSELEPFERALAVGKLEE